MCVCVLFFLLVILQTGTKSSDLNWLSRCQLVSLVLLGASVLTVPLLMLYAKLFPLFLFSIKRMHNSAWNVVLWIVLTQDVIIISLISNFNIIFDKMHMHYYWFYVIAYSFFFSFLLRSLFLLLFTKKKNINPSAIYILIVLPCLAPTPFGSFLPIFSITERTQNQLV